MESDDVKVKVPKVINSVRDKAMLEDFLRIVQTKVNEYNMKMGKGSVLRVAPVQWTSMARMLKAAIRDDATKHIAAKPYLRPINYEADHVFEVQYFVSVFLHTVAECINVDIRFRPDIPDILFALTIINSSTNLCPLLRPAHKFKSAFFRAAETKPNPLYESESMKDKRDKLRQYLENSVDLFSAFLKIQRDSIVDASPHGVFKIKLLDNIFATPWCHKYEWNAILYGVTPFSRNITFDNCVPNPWVDDNVMYEVMLAQCKKGKPQDDNWLTGADDWDFGVVIKIDGASMGPWDVKEAL